MEKKVGSTYMEYAYQPSGGEELGENNRSSWTVREVPFAGRHLVHYQGGTNAAYFMHADRLGSTAQVTDYTGAMAQDQLYYPFGQEWSMVGNYQEVRFARLQHRDTTETGLDPTAFRMYASGEGRWFSADPVGGHAGDPQSLNRYAYVHNQPINRGDSTGRDINPLDVPVECYDNPYLAECPCDPNDPTFGCRGGGGGCGVLMAVGDSGDCGPSLPPVEPPIPQPECFCQLKYRPINDPRVRRLHATHSFWYLQDSNGEQEIIHAEPSNPAGYGWLDAFLTFNIYTGDDNVSAATWFDSKLSSGNCDSADTMVLLYSLWPNDTIPYFVLGPNSNTFAHYLGSGAGFGYVPGPPGAVGWDIF